MRPFLAASFILVLFASPAHATLFNLSSSIDGAQAGTGSAASGSATLTFNDVTNEITWSGSFSGLEGDYAASHFHGPAAPGVGAGVALGFDVDLDGGNRSGTFVGNAVISASLGADVLAGLWYINIHSGSYPGGEIRGQVVPEPGTALLLGLGMLGLSLRRSVR